MSDTRQDAGETRGNGVPRPQAASARRMHEVDAKIHRALTGYPKTPLPPGFTRRVMARLTPQVASQPLRAHVPITNMPNASMWRLNWFDLTLAVFFTTFLLSIVYTLWLAVTIVEFTWLSELLAAWQFDNGALLSDPTWWIILLAAIICCQAGAAALWLLIWWDRSVTPSVDI